MTNLKKKKKTGKLKENFGEDFENLKKRVGNVAEKITNNYYF